MRISDWSSDVCSSDLQCPGGNPCGLSTARRWRPRVRRRDPRDSSPTSRQEGHLVDDNDQLEAGGHATAAREHVYGFNRATMWERDQIPAETSDELAEFADLAAALPQAFSQLSSTLERSAEHTSELQSLMRNTYAVFCLQKNKTNTLTPP